MNKLRALEARQVPSKQKEIARRLFVPKRVSSLQMRFRTFVELINYMCGPFNLQFDFSCDLCRLQFDPARSCGDLDGTESCHSDSAEFFISTCPTQGFINYQSTDWFLSLYCALVSESKEDWISRMNWKIIEKLMKPGGIWEHFPESRKTLTLRMMNDATNVIQY